MKVTEVKMRYIDDGGTVVAYADIILDNCFKVRGIAVLNTRRGLVVGMPFRVHKNGNSERGSKVVRDEIVHPINNDFRKELESAIFNEYEKGLRQ